jgi:DNA repair exonuclease SbcCD nuclease subunit
MALQYRGAATIRFIHTGDWQLGITRHFLSVEAQARYSEARLDAIRSIAKLARDEECSFVVVGGDVFDSNHLDRQTIIRALDAMASFTVPVYLLPGNHDSDNAASVYRSSAFLEHRPANVVVLDTPDPVAVPGTAAEVVGAPWNSKQPLSDLVAATCSTLVPPDAVLRVLVAHGAIDEGNPDPTNPSLICLGKARNAVACGCVHYIALGDRHSLTEVGETGRIWYAGTPLATDFGEEKPNHVLLVELDQESISVEPRQVGSWSFLRRVFDVNNRDEVDAVSEWLTTIAEKRNTVVKLSFVGTLSLIEKARLDAILEHFSDLFAALETWERQTDLAVLPDDGDLRDLGLTGFAADTLQELRVQAASRGESGEVAQDALSLLYRLAGGGE